MKRIACEACGSTDLAYKDGYFVCQYCGSRFLPEVDLPDRAEEVKDLLAEADELFEADRYDAAVRLYDKALRLDPKNVWAIGNRANARAWKTTTLESYVHESVNGVRDTCKILFEEHGDAPEYYKYCWIHGQRTFTLLNAIAAMFVRHYRRLMSEAADDAARQKLQAKLERETLGVCDTVLEILDIMLGYSDEYAGADSTFWRIMHIGIHNCEYYCTQAKVELPERCKECERRIKERWYAQYWAEHAEEKASLDAQRAQAAEQVVALRGQTARDAEEAEQRELLAQVKELEERRRRLGVFAVGERGKLRREAARLREECSQARSRALEHQRACEAEIETHNKRIAEIDEQLDRCGEED